MKVLSSQVPEEEKQMQAVSGVQTNNSNLFSSPYKSFKNYDPYGYQPLYFGGYGDEDSFEYQNPVQTEEKPAGFFSRVAHWGKNLLLIATAYAAYRYAKKHHWLDGLQQMVHQWMPGTAKA